MASDETGHADGSGRDVQVVILDVRAIEEMIGKIRTAAAAPSARTAVDGWRDAHGREAYADAGHDFAVVGESLMYLHDAPDGLLVPHAAYPDGTEKVYTDAEHADAIR